MRTLLWTTFGLFMFGCAYAGLTDETTVKTSTDRDVIWGFAIVGAFGLWRAILSWDRNKQEDLRLREIGTQRRIDQAVEKALAEERDKH